MANLYITEYAKLAHDVDGNPLQVPEEPALAEQAVSFTTSTQSAALNRLTTVVRLLADADCHIKFGTNPTATTSHQKLEANVEYLRGIKRGYTNLEIAAVTAS